MFLVVLLRFYSGVDILNGLRGYVCMKGKRSRILVCASSYFLWRWWQKYRVV